MHHLFFFAGLAFILTHEMDAIRCHEWRIFPLTAMLNEQVGYAVFTLVHVSLYVLTFWGLWNSGAQGMNANVVRAWDIFFIIHVGLHLLFLRHPLNEFKSWLSWLLIVGAGICGIADMVFGS
jgi:hypothetical protein